MVSPSPLWLLQQPPEVLCNAPGLCRYEVLADLTRLDRRLCGDHARGLRGCKFHAVWWVCVMRYCDACRIQDAIIALGGCDKTGRLHAALCPSRYFITGPVLISQSQVS